MPDAQAPRRGLTGAAGRNGAAALAELGAR